MKKLFLPLMLAVCVLLAACGQKQSSSSLADQSESVPAASEADSSVASSSGASSYTGEKILYAKAQDEVYSTDGQLMQLTKFSHNEFGLTDYAVLYGGDGKTALNAYQFLYDEKGNLTETLSTTAQGALNYHSVCTYDGKGQLVQVDYLDERGNIAQSERYAYNEDGTRSTETMDSKDESGNPIRGYTDYAYDANGELTETKQTDRDGTVTYTRHLSKALSELTDEDKIPGEKYSFVRITEEDDEGRIIAEAAYDEDGLYYQIEYEYDEAGNLVKTTNTHGDLLKLIQPSYYIIHTYEAVA